MLCSSQLYHYNTIICIQSMVGVLLKNPSEISPQHSILWSYRPLLLAFANQHRKGQVVGRCICHAQLKGDINSISNLYILRSDLKVCFPTLPSPQRPWLCSFVSSKGLVLLSLPLYLWTLLPLKCHLTWVWFVGRSRPGVVLEPPNEALWKTT